ncbi:MAG TPA: hypothetical protein VNL18_13565 [Gemmatimonadales bacterium]|nr:hypothetical protein [Gemmatimonadales bacterium]
MTAIPNAPRRARWAESVFPALFALSYVVGRVALDKLPLDPAWPRLVAALLPVAPAGLMLWKMINGVRRLDELHRRVHLEALVVAFPLAILLLMTLGLLELAIDLPTEDWSYRHVWVYLPFFYFVGLAIAWRRYK